MKNNWTKKTRAIIPVMILLWAVTSCTDKSGVKEFSSRSGFQRTRQTIQASDLAEIVQKEKLTNGILVLIEADDLVYQEAAATGMTVRGLETDSARVEALRNRFLDAGTYGKISVTIYDGKTLPIINSLVNIVVNSSKKTRKSEIMRILAPGGIAISKKGTETKAYPSEMGEWNQYLCNADNNGVAKDNAGPPERMQWTNGSRYGRFKNLMPSVTSMVTANGRVFVIEDIATPEGATVKKSYVLLARDAFNGCELWRRPLSNWDKEKLGPVKVIPVQLQRLLIAIGNRVICTDGFDGPVNIFDAATGKIILTFPETSESRELAYEDGVIYGIQGTPYAYKARTKEVKKLKIDDVKLYARDIKTGKLLWEETIKGSNGGKNGYIGGTLSIKGNNLCYITRTQLHCRNSKTGEKIWSREYPFWTKATAPYLTLHTSPPTIVMGDNQIFISELDQIRTYDLATGSSLWEAQSLNGYCKTGDLFFVDGLVWNGLLKGLDPVTGQVEREIEQSRKGPMAHVRCYRNRITQNYYINSETGGTDLVSLDGKGEYPSPWMRATCGLSMTPSYNRLYSSPYVCACEIGAMLLGFNCIYTQERDNGKVMKIGTNVSLIKGPAFAKAASGNHLMSGSASDWPTYRHNSERSGVASSTVPEQQKIAWHTKLPGKPTAPVIAGGMLFTSVKNMHTIFALDSKSGDIQWNYTADGPVDSPPTYYKGLILFGSRDGWVYCLDAKTGELAWKFSDLPDVRFMCAFEHLESAWPINGAVMVKDDLVYFAAGRSSFLDGGIVVYALNPHTGELKHRRVMAGPYGEDNFPLTQEGSQFRSEGFRGGIFSSKGDSLFIRHQGFKKDLTPISPYNVTTPHLISSSGFLTDNPLHRTYWTIDTDLSYGPGGGIETDGPEGDIMVVDGDYFFEVRGYAPGRHSNYSLKPSLDLYRVVAGHKVPEGFRGRKLPEKGKTVPRMRGWDQWTRDWTAQIPIAGHAVLKAGDKLMVAGVPVREGYSEEDIEASYSGKKGGLLWTFSAKDGKATGELELSAPPVWDGLAAADGNIFLTLKDGTVLCLDKAIKKQAPPKSRFIDGPTPVEKIAKP